MTALDIRRYGRPLLLSVLLVATLILTACGGDKSVRGDTETPTARAGEQQRESRAVRGRDINVRGLEGIPEEDRDMFTDSSNPLSVRIIYFAYDDSSIPSRFEKVIRAHGDYLANHPQVHLRLEGHTDERGTREYNVALGERRADSVKRALTVSGARSDQITTLSFGEERPAVDGSTEEAYAKNRRVEFIYVK